MEHHERITGSPFDERAALEKLERLREDIERYRAKRKAASEEFDAFVRSFKTPQPATGIQPRAEERSRRSPVQTAPRAKPEYAPSVPLAASPAAPANPEYAPSVPLVASLPARANSEDEPSVPIVVHPATPAAARARVPTPVVVGATLLLVAAGGWMTWRVWTRPAETTPTAPPPRARAAAPVASPRPAEPARQPAAPVSELTTSRRVWVRVVADGQRVVEGELPANARVPLTAEKSVVIRAGNAAVVRLTLRGQDQGPLGPEGAVVTRSFTVPPGTR